MSDFQDRLDQLIEDLELTVDERDYMQRHWKRNRTARRVMNLFAEVVQDRPMEKKKVLLRHLFEAVQGMRVEMAAARFVPPEGFVLIDEEALEAFRTLAALQLELLELGNNDPGREKIVRGMIDLARTAANLDPEVGAVAEEVRR